MSEVRACVWLLVSLLPFRACWRGRGAYVGVVQGDARLVHVELVQRVLLKTHCGRGSRAYEPA